MENTNWSIFQELNHTMNGELKNKKKKKSLKHEEVWFPIPPHPLLRVQNKFSSQPFSPKLIRNVRFKNIVRRNTDITNRARTSREKKKNEKTKKGEPYTHISIHQCRDNTAEQRGLVQKNLFRYHILFASNSYTIHGNYPVQWRTTFSVHWKRLSNIRRQLLSSNKATSTLWNVSNIILLKNRNQKKCQNETQNTKARWKILHYKQPQIQFLDHNFTPT